MSEWGDDNIKAFARVIENFGVAQDIRFCTNIEGRVYFAYVQVDKINFIAFEEEECSLMQRALQAPKEEEGSSNEKSLD